MANKDFVVKNGLVVSNGAVTIGSTERISSAGVFTGSLASANTATTQSASDNSTKIATTAYVDTAVTNIVDSAPAALNTLNELAAALGDDANYATTTTNALAAKLPLAGGTMTGDLILGDNVKVEVGSASGGDLQIYHDGSNSKIETGSGSYGDLYIASQGTGHDLYLRADDDIKIQPQGGEDGITLVGNGAVTLYHDASAKLATASDGVTITGKLTTSAGTSSIYNRLTISDGTNQLNIGQWDGSNHRIEGDSNRPLTIQSYNSTGISLGISGSNKLVVNGSGASITGTLGVTGETTLSTHLNMGDGDTIKLGDSTGDFELYHIGGSINVVRGTAGLVLQSDDTSYGIQMGTYSGGETMFKAVKNGAVTLYYDNNVVLTTQSGACKISSHGVGGNLNLFSDSGSSEGQFNITYLTDGASAEQSVAEIRMMQGSGDGGSRKGELRFRVSDNGGPADALIIYNNKQVQTAGDLIVGADVQMANGRGIAFTSTTPDGTSVASETLDDYEEGTWTPAIYTYSGVTTSSISTYGIYTKVGNICHVHAKITVTLSSLPGQTVTITGLPFTAKDSSDTQQRSIFVIGGDSANLGSYANGRVTFRTNGTQLQGITMLSGTTAYWAYNGMDSSSWEIQVSGSYHI